jgi:hypothetical protein
VQELICKDIFDAHDIWKIFQDLYDVPKCEDQDQRASMQSEATSANHSSSCAHDDISAKCDEKREIKGQMKIWGLSMTSRQLVRIKVQMRLQKGVLPLEHTLML